MMKRMVVLLLVLVILATALVGCGNTDTRPNDGEMEQTPTAPSESAELEDSAEPTEPGEEAVPTEPAQEEQVHYSQGLWFRPTEELTGEVGGYAVAGVGTCNTREIRIPDTYNGLPVVGIWGSAFQDLEWLTNVVIPDSVEWIWITAFDNCPNLEKLTIPDSVTDMGAMAVRNCPKAVETVDGVTYVDKWLLRCDPSITELNIRPDTVGLAENAVCGGLDGGFEGLTSVVIPNSVRYLGRGAFENCLGLKSITLSENIREIPSRAFYWCKALESITVPNGVTEIGEDAFYSCNALVTVLLPVGLEHIGRHAFDQCSSLAEIELPDTVTRVGTYAFNYCLALKRVKLSRGLTVIADHAFDNCSSLEIVEIPEGVTFVHERAFYGCNSVQELLLPESVTSDTLYFGAFEYVSPTVLKIGSGITIITEGMLCRSQNLEHIYYNGTKEAWESIRIDGQWLRNLSNCTVHCTDGDIVVG